MKVQRAKGYIIEREEWHAEMEAHKAKGWIMTRQSPMHRLKSKARWGMQERRKVPCKQREATMSDGNAKVEEKPIAPMEVQRAMGHVRAKAAKSEQHMDAKRSCLRRWRSKRRCATP